MNLRVIDLFVGCAIAYLLIIGAIRQAFSTECPNPGQPCKVLTITPDEERLLVGTPTSIGILPTAAQARQLDLGNYVAYFLQKISSAPAGDVKPKPEEKKDDKPAKAEKN